MSLAAAETPADTLADPIAVTVLVPARNEADDIAGCIDAIADQDLPLNRMEVIVVDGCSTDGTASIAEGALGLHPFAAGVVVSNPAASTPSNLNAGLAVARGAHLCRVDARSRVPRDYVRRCLAVLESRPDVVVVGGAQVATGRTGVVSAGIARALNNPLGMGLARYRAGRPSGPSDTVYLGAFRTAELRRAGGWDERWPTNQDFELNRRLGRAGTVWFEAELPVGYVPRPTLVDLVRQYHRFGRWKVRYWRRTGDRPRPRQLVLLAGGVVGIAGGGVLVAHALRSPGRFATTVGVGAAAAAAVESRSAGPDGGPTARVVSVAASAGVAGGWLSGVLREWLSSGERVDR